MPRVSAPRKWGTTATEYRVTQGAVRVHAAGKEVVVVCASAGARGLTHYGLIHSPSADLTATLAPMVTERLVRGEPVLAVLPPISKPSMST